MLTLPFAGVNCLRGFVSVQDLTAALVARVQAGPTEVVEELKARLALKEKLFQELLSDRSRQSNEHQMLVQDMLNTLGSKDQYLQVGRGSGWLIRIKMLSRIQCLNSCFCRTTPTGCPLLSASRAARCRSSASSCH